MQISKNSTQDYSNFYGYNYRINYDVTLTFFQGIKQKQINHFVIILHNCNKLLKFITFMWKNQSY